MAAPIVQPYVGDVPQRTQTPAVFSSNVDSFLTYIPPMVDELNISTDFVNTKAIEVNADAINTATAADTALAAANFKGRWSDATGAATIPSSYNHNNADWQLLQDIADITLDEPSNAAPNWQQISFREFYDADFAYGKDARVIDLIDGRPYVSTVNANLNHVPSTDDGTFWIVDLAVLDWGKGRDYAVNEQCYSAVDRRIYSSQVTPNLNHEPSVDDGTYWLTEYGKVTTPTMLHPLNLDTAIQRYPLLSASTYQITGSDSPQEWAVWQIATDNLFTDIVYDSGLVAAGDHRVTEGLLELSVHYVRVAYKGVRTDVSAFSPAVQFTTTYALSDYFNMSTDTGNGATIDIINNIDLTLYDGHVWIADRDNVNSGRRYATVEGLKAQEALTNALPIVEAEGLQSYNTNGLTVGSLLNVNGVGDRISSYTFRNKQGLFDVVPYVGSTLTAERRIAHNLNAPCDFFFIKRMDNFDALWSYDWYKNDSLLTSQAHQLAGNSSTNTALYKGDSSTFGVQGLFDDTNVNYLAYCFAHNPLTGIYIGVYTGNGTTQKITTGFPVGLIMHILGTSFSITDINNAHPLIFTDLGETVEDTISSITFNEDGFTVKDGFNNNGGNYYYVAIADYNNF